MPPFEMPRLSQFLMVWDDWFSALASSAWVWIPFSSLAARYSRSICMCMPEIIGGTKQDVLHALLTPSLNMVFNVTI